MTAGREDPAGAVTVCANAASGSAPEAAIAAPDSKAAATQMVRHAFMVMRTRYPEVARRFGVLFRSRGDDAAAASFGSKYAEPERSSIADLPD